MAFGQFVCWVCGAVPWAMLEATLTMSVGQIVCWCGEMVVGCCRFPWAMPKATLTMAVGQLCVGYVGWCWGVSRAILKNWFGWVGCWVGFCGDERLDCVVGRDELVGFV